MEVKLLAGNVYEKVDIQLQGNRMFLSFGYNKLLLDEVKASFEGRKWHGNDPTPMKVWSIPITQRNLFVLEYLKGKYGTDPFKRFDVDIKPAMDDVRKFCKKMEWPAREHQIEMAAHWLVRHWAIEAAEMRTGKTLASLIVMAMSGISDWYWLGPLSALRAVKLEFEKWHSPVVPTFMTYEGMKKVIANWTKGEPPPRGLVCDESSKLKTPTAQRTIAVKHLADNMRLEHGDDCFIGLLSGTPAPKSPADWWSQCEIACPGFIREKDIHTFKQRLALVEQVENVSGAGSYPQLLAWLDDENKCAVCGQLKDAEVHGSVDAVYGPDSVINTDDFHTFKPSVNEVAKLYNRMKGLVLVKLRKDCMDLPDKQYDIVRTEVTPETIRLAKLIVATSTRTIEALTRLRELSDGFQYTEIKDGLQVCPRCGGTKTSLEWFDPADESRLVDPEEFERNERWVYNEDYEVVEVQTNYRYESRSVTCRMCQGSGEVDRVVRSMSEYPCPKDDIVREELDLHNDVGRLNIYAGFTASVDRVTSIVRNAGWGVIRADGRGWMGWDALGHLLDNDKLLQIYESGDDRVAFVGQPGAAGMGMNLAASPTTMFFSNDFNGESRLQAEDRGMGLSMDMKRGGRIVDIIHLDSDLYVLENLKKKKRLQHLSLTGLKDRIH